jgi:hypothetical protein
LASDFGHLLPPVKKISLKMAFVLVTMKFLIYKLVVERAVVAIGKDNGMVFRQSDMMAYSGN